MVMSGGGEADVQPTEGAERRYSMTMTDAELRRWLQNPQWRAQLPCLIVEET